MAGKSNFSSKLSLQAAEDNRLVSPLIRTCFHFPGTCIGTRVALNKTTEVLLHAEAV